MIECEPPGVKHQAAGLLCGFAGFAIDWIADERCALVMKVDTDLMGAAGVKVAADERGEAGRVSSEDFVIGDGGFSPGWIDDCHFLAIHRMATDVGKNGIFGGLGDALGDGKVKFFHRSTGKLVDEGLVGDVGLGDNDAAGRVLVEAVNDAGTLDAADAGELPAAVVKKGIDEGTIGIARSGVNDHAGGFIDDDQILILEQDFQWNFLSLIMKGNSLGENHSDSVA